jgi:DNA helicase HerA-like ATPase
MNEQNNFYFLYVDDNNLFKILFLNKNKKERPKLGDFLILENEEVLILCRVEKESYFLEYSQIKEVIERIKEIGIDLLEEMEKEDLNKLIYHLLPLAILNKRKKQLSPSYRNIPLHLETTIRKPSFHELAYFLNQEYLKNKNYEEFLNTLAEKNINEENIFEKEKEFTELFNGEIIGYYNSIPIIFNINKFLAKRTGVFARTGYGKSNAVKTIILKLLKLSFLREFEEKKDVLNDLVLVYDINGEYAFTNEQNIGFAELFENNDEQFLVLTNKKFSYNFVKPLKIDFSSLEISEIVDLLIEAFSGEEIKAYTYFEEVKGIWLKELFKLAVEKEKNSTGKSEKEFDKANIRRIVSFVIQYLRDLLQILSSDLKKDLIELDESYRKEGKNNIVLVINEMKKLMAKSDEMQKRLKNAALKEVNIGAMEWRIKKVFDNLYHPKGISSKEIKEWYDKKKLVIIDLSSLDDWAGSLISSFISKKIFQYSQEFFLENKKYNVITIFEEAQNLLDDITKNNNIFVRMAKEGRKFNIAMFAITQQPSSISPKILSQLDNYLAFHLLNDDDINSLSKANSHYSGLVKYLLKYEPIKGQCFFYSSPEQPFVIQLQFKLFDKEFKEVKKTFNEFLKEKDRKEKELLESSIDLF